MKNSNPFFNKAMIGKGLIGASAVTGAYGIYDGVKYLSAGRKVNREFVLKQLRKSRDKYQTRGLKPLAWKADQQIDMISMMSDSQFKKFMYLQGGMSIIASIIGVPLTYLFAKKHLFKK